MGGRREVQEGGTYVCLWLIHITVWQKPTQHYKTIINEIKWKILKKILRTNLGTLIRIFEIPIGVS